MATIFGFPTKPRDHAEQELLEHLVRIVTQPRPGLDGITPKPMPESEARAKALRLLSAARKERDQ